MTSLATSCDAQCIASAGLRLTVITICRNESGVIGRTIQSIIDQTCQEFEWIVVDGASTDGTADVVKKMAGQRLNGLLSEPDQGIYDAMNKGVSKAQGDYILFLNGGDEFHNPRVIESCLPLLGKADIVHGGVQVVQDGSPRNAPIFGYQPGELPIKPTFFYKGMIPHPASFIRRTLFNSIGLHDISFRIAGDVEWMHRAAVAGSRFQENSVVVANFHLGGISTHAATKRLCDIEVRKFQIRRFPIRYACNQIRAVMSRKMFFLPSKPKSRKPDKTGS